MMYSEFVAGTGCKRNEHNYKVFKRLEAMYMNTDMSKEEVYEYGKKLVDNSKSPEELQAEMCAKAEIGEAQERIRSNKERIDMLEQFISTEADIVWRNAWRDEIKGRKQENKRLRAHIQALRSIFA